jgi:hypothetical protein
VSPFSGKAHQICEGSTLFRFVRIMMLVMFFSACNVEEHKGIDPATGGSRRAAPPKI